MKLGAGPGPVSRTVSRPVCAPVTSGERAGAHRRGGAVPLVGQGGGAAERQRHRDGCCATHVCTHAHAHTHTRTHRGGASYRDRDTETGATSRRRAHTQRRGVRDTEKGAASRAHAHTHTHTRTCAHTHRNSSSLESYLHPSIPGSGGDRQICPLERDQGGGSPGLFTVSLPLK